MAEPKKPYWERTGVPLPRRPHSSFIDLTGQTIAGVQVVERAKSQAGTARWLVEFPCKHRKVFTGIALRSTERRGGKSRCGECMATTTLVGETVAGVEVLDQDERQIRVRVKILACGHTRTVSRDHLKAVERQGKTLPCRGCTRRKPKFAQRPTFPGRGRT